METLRPVLRIRHLRRAGEFEQWVATAATDFHLQPEDQLAERGTAFLSTAIVAAQRMRVGGDWRGVDVSNQGTAFGVGSQRIKNYRWTWRKG